MNAYIKNAWCKNYATIQHQLPIALVGLLLSVAGCNLASAQLVDTIALYEFENATNLFLDSSGSGNTLGGGSGVIQSTTEYSTSAPTTVSAYFDGSQSSASKIINFSSYDTLSFNWYMKTAGTLSGSDYDVLFESSWDVNLTGFFSIRLLPGEVEGSHTLRVVQNLEGGWYNAYYTISDPSSWASYSVSIDNTVTDANSHVTFLINGVEQTASSVSYTGTSAVFLDGNYFWVGTKNAGANAYDGYLQYVQITGSTIPEPSGAVVWLGLVCFGFLAFRRS